VSKGEAARSWVDTLTWSVLGIASFEALTASVSS
jgi:hypothetical protein